jgi:hypothetical protein
MTIDRMTQANEWKTIDTAVGDEQLADEYTEVLLSDGETVRVGCIIKTHNGNRGLVSGMIGTLWTHWMPLPAPPSARSEPTEGPES